MHLPVEIELVDIWDTALELPGIEPEGISVDVAPEAVNVAVLKIDVVKVAGFAGPVVLRVGAVFVTVINEVTGGSDAGGGFLLSASAIACFALLARSPFNKSHHGVAHTAKRLPSLQMPLNTSPTISEAGFAKPLTSSPPSSMAVVAAVLPAAPMSAKVVSDMPMTNEDNCKATTPASVARVAPPTAGTAGADSNPTITKKPAVDTSAITLDNTPDRAPEKAVIGRVVPIAPRVRTIPLTTSSATSVDSIPRSSIR